ncbi:MAG: hypothetical protein R3B93_28735 [Bacteroidia bacterium]
MNLLHYHKYYQSPIIFDKYDLVSHYDFLIFSTDGMVRIGTLDENSEFKELGSGGFKMMNNQISFTIRKHVDNHESNWYGEIRKNGIEIRIENADFEDVDGLYTLVL